jgi:hypothetical protein
VNLETEGKRITIVHRMPPTDYVFAVNRLPLETKKNP